MKKKRRTPRLKKILRPKEGNNTASHDVFFYLVYFIAIILLISLLFYGYWDANMVEEPIVGTLLGEKAPLFNSETLEGRPYLLKDKRGTPVIINFWATWCTPCVREMPILQEIHEKYGEEITIIGVNMGQGKERIRSFLEKVPVTYTIIMDQNEDIQEEYNIRFQPSTFFLDEQGIVRDKKLGEIKKEDLFSRAEKLLE